MFLLPRKVLDYNRDREPIKQIFLTQLSAKPPNCFIAAICSRKLYICRPGSKFWMDLREVSKTTYHEPYDMFYKGELYCILKRGIVAYNIVQIYNKKNFSSTRRTVVLFDDEQQWLKSCKAHYLVESGGELLMVTKYVQANDNKVIRFLVQRLDHDNGGLVPVNDLGDRMLFLGIGCSQSWCRPKDNRFEPSEFFTKNCIYLLTASEFFTKNCIYFFTGTVPNRLAKFHLDGVENKTKKSDLELFQYGYEFPNMKQGYEYWFGHYSPVWINPTRD